VIGSLYAAHLARRVDVWVLARRPEHARALAEHGLRVSGKGDFTTRLSATADPVELPDAELVIVATKATDLEEAATRLADRLPGAAVMTIQNGLGAEEIVRAHGGSISYEPREGGGSCFSVRIPHENENPGS